MVGATESRHVFRVRVLWCIITYQAWLRLTHGSPRSSCSPLLSLFVTLQKANKVANIHYASN